MSALAVQSPNVQRTSAQKAKVSQQYQKKSHLEHIKERPDTYIGSCESRSEVSFFFGVCIRGSCCCKHQTVFVVPPGLWVVFNCDTLFVVVRVKVWRAHLVFLRLPCPSKPFPCFLFFLRLRLRSTTTCCCCPLLCVVPSPHSSRCGCSTMKPPAWNTATPLLSRVCSRSLMKF